MDPKFECQIGIKGHLPADWSQWFDGLSIENGIGGEALLFGPLPDQSALLGVLIHLNNLGIQLVFLSCYILKVQTQVEQGRENDPAPAQNEAIERSL